MRIAYGCFILLCFGVVLLVYSPSVGAQTVTPTPKATRRMIVYLPIVTGPGNSTVTILAGQPAGSVYALLGQLHQATSQTFGNYLLTNDGQTYALAGANPAIEQQIEAFRKRQPPAPVKVWGSVYRLTTLPNVPMILVSDIVLATVSGSAPTTTAPMATVKFDLVNLRLGPGNGYQRSGQVTRGQRCVVLGRNRAATWWEISCANGEIGWIDRRLVDVQGDTSDVLITEPEASALPPTPLPPTPTSLPTPTPTPPAIPSFTWRASYYNNTNLSGAPIFVQDLPGLDFNWGAGGPTAGLPVDNFSARFERTVHFSPGFYRFSVTADDGVRVWLDDQLMIDEWRGASSLTFATGRSLAGNHTLRVEYFEAGGLANLRFAFDFVTGSPEWTAEYFAGTELRGDPIYRQQEARTTLGLDYIWGSASPLAPTVPIDNWSARWVGRFRFDSGNYIFRAMADDGVRVYINNILVLDGWQDGYNDLNNHFFGIGADVHTIRIEYYERTGYASVRVWWYKDTTTIPQ